MNGFIHCFTVSSGWIFVDLGWKYDWPPAPSSPSLLPLLILLMPCSICKWWMLRGSLQNYITSGSWLMTYEVVHVGFSWFFLNLPRNVHWSPFTYAPSQLLTANDDEICSSTIILNFYVYCSKTSPFFKCVFLIRYVHIYIYNQLQE